MSKPQTTRTTWAPLRCMPVFVRDRFTDRYSGTPLVFPGALRLLSLLMPTEFPFHPNWRQSETHPAYWELSPTIDHVVPLARGGTDDESNVVTTSMLRNAAKSNWTLQELGWSVLPVPAESGWDGLLPWFMEAYEQFEVAREHLGTREWHRVAKSAA
ncbi:HNH endonuclease [Ramlibacter albus]|uniref:HNH endonuclease n=1 Tax=Ramlibacter albus TaxID=2079448 RepID=A0A923S5T1_9BURK|nr:hypothetical protein [Ramlibacter albus]MBC5768338.1 hypothetical protein [Ramlibacter albus]